MMQLKIEILNIPDIDFFIETEIGNVYNQCIMFSFL